MRVDISIRNFRLLILGLGLSVGLVALANLVIDDIFNVETPSQAPPKGEIPVRLAPTKLGATLELILQHWDTGDFDNLAANREEGSILKTAPKLLDSIFTEYVDDEWNVAVTIHTDGYTDELVEWLGLRNVVVGSRNGDQVETYVPINLLAELSHRSNIASVEAIHTPNVTVVSEGVASHGVPTWHAAGLGGAGVKIGILDGGFEGFVALQGTELPSSVFAYCRAGLFQSPTSNIADCDTTVSEHGTALAETVYDVAPDATFYIANFLANDEWTEAVQWMIDEGVDIITQSTAFDWSGYGDGTSPFSTSPLNGVNTAVDADILVVTSAGNEASRNWFGSYEDSDADDWMEFEPGVELNPITLTSGNYNQIQMRWDDDWGSASRDLNLCLIDPDGVTVISCTTRVQDGVGTDYPKETMSWTSASSDTYYLAVVASSVVTPPAWIQLRFVIGATADIANSIASVGTPGESANPGLLAVGAAPHFDTSTTEFFSSRGPTVDGRIKPDIVGADQGSTVTYGPYDPEDPGITGFAGTSQAAPHVAGLAALVLQRFPNLSVLELADYLRSNADPRGTVPNNEWGAGFAQMTPTPPDAPTSVVAVGGVESASVSWTAPVFDGGSTVTGYTVTSSPDSVTAAVDGVTLVAVVSGLTADTGYTFTVTATNLDGASDVSAASNSVIPTTGGNSLPVSVDDTYSIDEDGSLVVSIALGVLDNDSDTNGDPMTAAVSTGVSDGSLSLSGDGSFTYTPDADFNGSDSFTYTASDAEGAGAAATVTITVDAVNDIPSFTVGSDVIASPDDGAQAVSSWISVMSSGPSNESGQALSFTVGNDDNTLFTVQPSVSAAGTLSFTPSSSANGVANVTISIQDDGGTTNGGQDSSGDQFFTITVAPTVGGSMSLQSVSVGGSEFASVGPTVKLVRASDSFEYNFSVENDGSFSVDGVAAGTYVITVSADGYQSAHRTGQVVASSNLSLGSVQLLPGMVNSGTVVDGVDLSLVVGSYGTSTGDRTDGSGNWVDLNADGAVSGQDISSVIVNIGVSGMQSWP